MTNAFQPYAEKMQVEGLPELAIETFRHYYDALRSGATGSLTRREIDPPGEIPHVDSLADHTSDGRAALARAVVIKLNGGLGTSMGMTRAKSLLPVKDGLTFLDIIVRQVLHLRETHNCQLPLLLMNSFRTREDSLRALDAYPEIECGIPLDFVQHKVPRIRADDLRPLDWPRDPSLEWCPPGHGDLYTALVTSGTLDLLLDRGFEYAFVSNADNLGAALDLRVLGHFAREAAPFLMEVCDRSPADKKGGHLARLKDGRLALRETAQCPEDEWHEFTDVGVFPYFNTNNLWMHLPSLRSVLHERESILDLPMIRNEKTADPRDPTSPAVIQLETAMGAAVSAFEGAIALGVPRPRFAPVKTTNDLLMLWSDLYRLAEDFRVVPAGNLHARDIAVDLDPGYYQKIDDLTARFPKGPPSLLACTSLEIRGDVHFGASVVLEGDVSIHSKGDAPHHVPDNARLGS